MVAIRIYVEGGGDRRALLAKCRQGFCEFLEKVMPPRRMPRIIACGTRRSAFDRFCTALSHYSETFCMLLVDSETAVAAGMGPWAHLKSRTGDGWNKPTGATDDHAHLMVQCMEAWFLADKDCLARYFGQGFNAGALPANPNIEAISKADIYSGLKKATRNTKTKGKYQKGNHSFDILGKIDPQKVRQASPHAERLVNTLVKNASA